MPIRRSAAPSATMRFVGKMVVVAALACGTLLVGTQPAAAHGVQGIEPIDYDTRILSVEPSIDGLEIRPVDLGQRIELRNTSDVEVLVLGYLGEPYLRVGPDGVFENRASPSWVANREPDGTIPDRTVVDGDDDRPPQWVRTGDGPTVAWHDHRTHWMGSEPPAAVQEDPGSRHQVLAFEIELEHGDHPVVVTGEVLWVPPPSPWPWLLSAIALGIAVIALSRTRVWPQVLGGALAVLVVTETVHVLGVWNATTAGVGARLAAIVYSLVAIVIGTAAIAWLTRTREPYDATPLVLLAGVFLVVSGGLADVAALSRSQIPTTLPSGVARAAVMAALGLGGGITVAAALRIRRPRPRRTTGAHSDPAAPVAR